MIIKEQLKTLLGVRFYKIPGETKLRNYSFPQNMFTHEISLIMENGVENFLIETDEYSLRVPVGNIVSFEELEQGRKFRTIKYDNGAFCKVPVWNSTFSMTPKSSIEFIEEQKKVIEKIEIKNSKPLDGKFDELMKKREMEQKKNYNGLLDKLMEKQKKNG